MLAAAGCGGGSSGTGSTNAGSTASIPSGDSPAERRLIATADAICGRFNTEIATTKPAGVGASELARSAPVNASLEQAALRELSKLTPPASLAGDWRRVIADRRTLAEELVKLGRYAKANNAAGIRALVVSKKAMHRELLKTATRAGFADCARVG
jgi:hypothetical protein